MDPEKRNRKGKEEQGNSKDRPGSLITTSLWSATSSHKFPALLSQRLSSQLACAIVVQTSARALARFATPFALRVLPNFIANTEVHSLHVH